MDGSMGKYSVNKWRRQIGEEKYGIRDSMKSMGANAIIRGCRDRHLLFDDCIFSTRQYMRTLILFS